MIRPGEPRRVSAFTLIEVLAAMAVLVILILALTRMFVEAANISKRGTTTLMRNSVNETAMDTILQDLDSMIINERLTAAKFADDVKYLAGDPQGAFDTFYFITTSGDQDDDLPYEYTKYYVRPILTNNVNGAAYWRYDLYKSRMIMAVGADAAGGSSFYALRQGDQEWWDPFENHTDDSEVMAENVVMFDIYCQRWDTGADFVTRGDDYFSLDKVDRGGGVSNVPPVAIDVMLVTTSPEAAVEGGMLLAAGERERGLAVLNRDASTVIGRAMPMMGPTQYRLQRRIENPLSHYYIDRK
ncbi:MAG: type II secretion system protein J [Kiritimatiellia bacterium]